MNSKVGILVFIVMFVFVSGCWSRYEIQTLAFVGGIGIDIIKENGKDRVLLTTNIYQPSLVGGGQDGGGGFKGKPIYLRVTATGDTIEDAERNINTRIARKLFFGEARFVLVGEKVAQDRLMDVIDYLQRNEEIRKRILMIITKGRASDVIIKSSEMESTIAKQVSEMAESSGPDVSKVKIWDLLRTTDQLITPGQDPVIAQIMTSLSIPTKPESQPVEVFRFAGGGVIKEGKLVGWLEEAETRGYLLATGQANRGALTVRMGGRSKLDTSIAITHAKGNVKMKASGNDVTAKIDVKVEGDLIEYYRLNKIATNEGVHGVEDAFNKEIRQEVMAAVKKAQELDADIFGFGSNLHRDDPKAWKKLEKDWYEIFPKVKVELNVISHIRRTGFISNPYIPK